MSSIVLSAVLPAVLSVVLTSVLVGSVWAGKGWKEAELIYLERIFVSKSEINPFKLLDSPKCLSHCAFPPSQ